MPVLNPRGLLENRVAAIREYHESCGVPKAEIDLSGGVDSAVIIGLLAKALGPENVIAVHSQINSNPDALVRAQEAADTFGVKLCVIDLTPMYETLVAATIDAMAVAGYDTGETRKRIEADKTVLGSIRSTLRAPVGRGFNRIFGGGIRHGTGNECEDRWMRFYQKGGDGEVDTNPIAMLSKGEVFQLALVLGVPRSIITARPSPDLWGEADGHNDEDEIGNYLGFNAAEHDQTFYSYIDPETGAYTHVGLIERVSRFLDIATVGDGQGQVFQTIENTLFEDDEDDEALVFLGDLHALAAGGLFNGRSTDLFAGLSGNLTRDLLLAAKRVERITRHKLNPNCPALGNRESLVEAGILTDTLPEISR